MSKGRLSLGFAEGLFSVADFFPDGKLRDITAEINKRIFHRIPKGSQVSKSSMCVVGAQGCGKSVLLAYIWWLAVGIYGEDRVHLIYTDDIRIALAELNPDKPVQLVIVDDAMTNASSRQIYEQTEILKVYNRSRHVFMELLKGKPGHIIYIYIWAWQRFGELDPAFRQADVILFKSGIAEPSERRVIEGFMGPWYTRVLWQMWDMINRGNNAVKSLSVARIASLDEPFGTGIYRSEMPPIELPEILRADDYFSDTEAEDERLEVLEGKAGWGRRVEAYRMYRGGGMTQAEIGEALGMTQGQVSDAVSKVKKELKR